MKLGSHLMRTTWETPDLSLVQPQTAPVPRFPVEILGDDWQAWVTAAAAAHNTPEDYIGASLLAVAGALMGNARQIEVGAFRQPPLLWTMLVGKPSSNKSGAINPFQAVLADIEVEIGNGSLPGFWDENPQAEPQLRVVDVTPAAAAEAAATSPKGLLLLKDELSGWFRRYGSDPFWLEAYMANPYTVNRKGKPLIKTKRLAISVLGGCQPDTLRSHVENDVDRGFAARWLYIFPEPRLPGRSRSLDLTLPKTAFMRLARLELNHGKPVTKKASRRAAGRVDSYNIVTHRRMSDEEGMVGGWIGKQAGTALRLALIIEYLWWSTKDDEPEPIEISSRAYQAATKFIDDYASPMMLRTLSIAVSASEDRDALALIRVLKRDHLTGFNARELRRTGRSIGLLAQPKVLAAACDSLEEACLIRRLKVRAGDTPGRGRADYEVNPAVL